MSTTLIIDANRSISKFKDDNKLRWTNTLEGGLQLKKGDKISIQGSQINQRGSNVETLNFAEDINEEIIFCYYITDNDVEFAGTTSKVKLYRDGTARPVDFGVGTIGHLNSPYIYFGDFHGDLRPYEGTQKVAIPAGSYSPDNISTILSEMFAGKYTANKIPFDYIRDDALRTFVNFPGLCVTSDEFMITISPNNLSPSATTGDCPMFLQPRQAKDYIDDILNDGVAITKSTLISEGKHWITTQSYDPSSDDAQNPINQYQFLGSVPTLKWDPDSSRFTLNDLHVPYRLPNYDGKEPNENRGEMASEFYRDSIPFGKYPKMRFGGVMITNPAWNYVSTNTDIGKDIAQKIVSGSDTEKRQAQVKKTTYKFVDYFTSTAEAKEAWRNTFWYRLGFDMEQFTDDTKWEDFYSMDDIKCDDGVYTLKDATKPPCKMLGITTNQNVTTDMATSSGGLANGNTGESGKGFVNQAYSYEVPGKFKNTSSNPSGSVSVPDYYVMLTQGLALTARRLPQLNDQPYYNIWSDLVDNSNWFSNQGSRNTLMAQTTKNYSAGDYIYGFDSGITFTLTKDKTINEITTEILNPDDTSPNPELFDENCAVLYKIERFPEPVINKKSK
tara:strand:- start:486 stop:2327 length:1842 start_codon:yes stop_codon:yes gene_type:complete